MPYFNVQQVGIGVCEEGAGGLFLFYRLIIRLRCLLKDPTDILSKRDKVEDSIAVSTEVCDKIIPACLRWLENLERRRQSLPDVATASSGKSGILDAEIHD